MTGKGHTWVGIVCSIAAYKFSKDYNAIPLIASIATILGATAPDWLEIRKKNGGTVIKHRTITHYLPIWLVLFFIPLGYLTGNSFIEQNLPSVTNNIFTAAFFSFLLGFSFGGLTHLLTDLPNPMGIPIIAPNVRFSLKLWKSGKFEPAITFFFLLIVMIYIGVLKIDIDGIRALIN